MNGYYTAGNATFPPGTQFENRGTTLHGYTNTSFPKVNEGTSPPTFDAISVNYYDNYDFNFDTTPDYSYTAQSLPNEGTSSSAFGLPTGGKRLILGTSTWLSSYTFYDQYARVIQVRSNNHLSATIDNLVTYVYDFEGKVTRTKIVHSTPNGTSLNVIRRPEYDHAGRVVKIYQQYNSQASEQLVAQFAFNELGQVVDKKLHNTTGTTFLQSLDYRYNIRGWLKSINNATLTNDGTINDDSNDYFGMELNYDVVDASLSNTAYYNGNISAVKWKGFGAVTGNSERRSYKFTYDKTDRLKDATFKMYGASSWDQEVNTLDEQMTYDNNGNILNLTRKQNKRSTSGLTVTSSAQVIDNLTYTYTAGNRLSKVEDAAISAGFTDGSINGTNEYTYDANGSMIADKNKGINEVKYNELGKVSQITFADGRIQTFVYDAVGAKLTSKMFANTGVLQTRIEYVDGFQYENGMLMYQPSPEGRVQRRGKSTAPAAVEEGLSTAGFSLNQALVSLTQINGESYIKCVSNNANVNIGPGFFHTNQITSAANKRYVFRVKGHVPTGQTERPLLVVQNNAGYILRTAGAPALPVGQANEDWINFEFVAPSGTTWLQAGVFWWYGDSTPIGREFYINKIELLEITDEYQYAINDHQGNTRVVFSSVPGTPKVSVADMESMTNTEFPNYSSVFRNGIDLYDHTDVPPANAKSYSNLLNGGYNQQIGVAKSYKVMPGDEVKIVAYAKYNNKTSTASNLAAFGTALLGAFSASIPTTVDGIAANGALNNYGGIVAAGSGSPTDPPKAYVNILVFDENHNFLDGAFDQINPAANQVGVSPFVPHDTLTAVYPIKQPGYVYMYVSNESPYKVDVYFDDITMTHTPGNIIQYNEYYPFGMRTASSWDRVDEKSVASLQTALITRVLFDGNANDASGNSNNGTISGGATTTTAHGRPEAILLDGNDDYVQINDNSTLDFGANDFSVAFWVKKLAASAAWDNTAGVSKWNTGGSPGTNEWNISLASTSGDNKPTVFVEMGSATQSVTSADNMVIAQWYHLTAQRQGSLLKIYVNGVLKGTTNIGTGAINNVGRHLLIGKIGSGNNTNALYDDLYIYNRALTEEEIRMLYLDKPEMMVNNYLYNGASEYNGNSEWYETFFRGYDQKLGRFLQVDPKADKYSGLSPYNFATNSPINFNDPLGDDFGVSDAIYDRLDKLTQYYSGTELGDWFSGFASGIAGEYGGGLSEYISVTTFLNNGLASDYGGHWQNGKAHYFKSHDEAFEAGVSYNNRHNSWGQTYYGSHEVSMLGYTLLLASGQLSDPIKLNEVYHQFKQKMAASQQTASVSMAFPPIMVAAAALEELLMGAGLIGGGLIAWNGHGNSKNNPNKSWVYVIYSTGLAPIEQVEKYGITTPRAEKYAYERPQRQVNHLNKVYSPHSQRQYDWNWITSTKDRMSALVIEKWLVTVYFLDHGKMPNLQKNPIPEIIELD